MMNQCITINTKKNNILLKINEEAEQKEIVACLKEKIKDLKKLYKDDTTPIRVTGKILKNKEIEEIQSIIKSVIDVEVEFDSPRALGLHEITKTYNQKIHVSDTKYHLGSIRSGQRIEYEGSLVIVGDVNDGAEIIAGENVVVVGCLRGLAHAGAKGNKDAWIAASSIESLQIRIANIIKETARDEIGIGAKKTYACIGEDGNITIQE